MLRECLGYQPFCEVTLIPAAQTSLMAHGFSKRKQEEKSAMVKAMKCAALAHQGFPIENVTLLTQNINFVAKLHMD